MENADFEKIELLTTNNASDKKELLRLREQARSEMCASEKLMKSDLKNNKYSINNNSVQIHETSLPIKIITEKKPSIITFEGEVLEERLKNPFFLKAFTGLMIDLPVEQVWLKTSIHKKNDIAFSAASKILSGDLKNYVQDNEKFTPFESMWYASLDENIMDRTGFPGYESCGNKLGAMGRISDYSITFKVGLKDELNRYNKFKKYQTTPIEDSVNTLLFNENYSSLFK